VKLSLDADHEIYRIYSYAHDTVVVQNPQQSLPAEFPRLEREQQRALLYSQARASFVISLERLDLAWSPPHLEGLRAEHLEALLSEAPEVVLLGTGQRLRFPAPEVSAPLVRAGVGMEVMDSGAACRTYNILASEGRRVVAAVLMCP